MDRRGLLMGLGSLTLLTLTGCGTTALVLREEALVSDSELHRCILKSAADIGWVVVKDVPTACVCVM